ncbi:hypothetical protein BX666DRAFT_1300148 [Dichotomocladium elegans]|nr:hypothetical protein BX666DRAFT_1300148 [Dichotomocladium elegans]
MIFPSQTNQTRTERDAHLGRFHDQCLESSLGSLFKHFVTSNTDSKSLSPQFQDAAGSDFKRLAAKSRIKREPDSLHSIHTLVDDETDDDDSPRPVHYGFAVGHPIILPIPPQQPQKQRSLIVEKIHDWLFAREDRYFNADRRELSKDIFPAGYDQTGTRVKEPEGKALVHNIVLMRLKIEQCKGGGGKTLLYKDPGWRYHRSMGGGIGDQKQETISKQASQRFMYRASFHRFIF